MAVVPEGHRLAHRKRLALSELEQEDFVLFQRKHATGLFDQIISACGDAGFSPRIQRQPALMQTLLSEVAAGVGIAIAPGCIRRLQCDGCRFIPLRPALGAVPLELHYPTTPGRPVIDALRRTGRRAPPRHPPADGVRLKRGQGRAGRWYKPQATEAHGY